VPAESSPPAATPPAELCSQTGVHYSEPCAPSDQVWNIRLGVRAVGLAAWELRPEVQIRDAGSRIRYAGILAR
jgi:hypothetical protein